MRVTAAVEATAAVAAAAMVAAAVGEDHVPQVLDMMMLSATLWLPCVMAVIRKATLWLPGVMAVVKTAT